VLVIVDLLVELLDSLLNLDEGDDLPRGLRTRGVRYAGRLY